MICGSASGELLPPYTVYKAKYVYESWCNGGPKGAVYACSKSGWIDMFLFSDCFNKTILPHLRKLPGKKLLLGDNLASHISMSVIKSCKENDIEFVCFPPHATNLLQPLDLGFFSSMKAMWRNLLTDYTKQDPSAKLLPKNMFPKMLKELYEVLKPETCLPNAFAKCRLFPLAKDTVLKRLLSVVSSEETAQHVDRVLLHSPEA